MIFSKDKYLPLTQGEIRGEQMKYLLNKIDFYLKQLNKQVMETEKLKHKIKLKGYSDAEATELTELEHLTDILQTLNKAKRKILLAQKLDGAEISAINEVYSNLKLRITIFDPLKYLPKKRN